MTEADLEEHCGHLTSLMALLPPPPLALVVGEALARLRRGERAYRVGAKGDQWCPYCHSRLGEGKEARQEVRKGHLVVTCRRCARHLATKEVQENRGPETEEKSLVMESSQLKPAMEEPSKPKKKRKAKEANAGLVLPSTKKPPSIPPSKPPPGKPSPKTQSLAKNKLRLLMANSQTPKRSGLQDFLKKL